LSRRLRFLAPVVGALVAFILNAALWLRSEPEPVVHDEFSYLLAADTFAHGRLTNPTHPMWRHFETVHVLQRPSYQSKYPPGQGLVLAAGIVATGMPIAGVWVSFALACAALTWMLQAFLPPRWALFGGLLAAVHPVMGAWWGQTYWGGALPMAGGALVYGAVPRLIRRARASTSAWLGIGLAVLASTRPVEGALAAAPAIAFLAWRRLRAGRGLPRATWVPAALIVTAAVAWLGYYNWRVTGDALLSPWQLWADTYQRPGAEMHPDLRRYHGSLDLGVLAEAHRLSSFYAPFPLAFGLAGLWWTWRSRWTRALLAASLAVVAVSVAVSRAWPHYTAPVAAALMAVFVQGFRGLWRAGRRPALRVCVVLWPLLPFAAAARNDADDLWMHGRLGRAEMIRFFEGTGDDHLVFVRYAADHDATVEWVYNAADIDAAHVVWAREVSPGDDAELARHFAGRRAWVLLADEDPPRLMPRGPRRTW
jgi:hypothetical protein